MLQKKVFDWEVSKKIRSPKTYKFLKENYGKPLTLEEFVKGMQEIRQFSQTSKHYSRSNLKNNYKRLKENFGFFKS